ncbi:hypothetical protein BZA05DRAFT_384725 [Tricharina praecox]|uniref:uncharacterized protein n=1 Tax=Tricharina praecox TaxID=43433 RepID=UPI002220C453|nr:uncharacterized protein BZA05DRAFT_384725 [Tricharina praecox]KAI5857759.1 hypothetical protein BZA05DRAFT_384725 [Tricharina praecox]
MRSAALFTLLLSSVFAGVLGYGWSKEDHEIFRIRDELEMNEGEGVTFYDFVGVKNGPAASMDDINKAYRKTSARLHPDKFKPAKGLGRSQQAALRKKASERFARLGLIANVLRGEGRDRYDHFLRNGFPKWRGTGYYYARFRPGIGSVLIGIYLFVGVAHYAVLGLTAKRQKDFMKDVIRDVRTAAYGPAGIPGLEGLGEASSAAMVKPKKAASKRGASGTASPPTAQRKRVGQANGKTFMVDPNGDVFLLNETEDGPEELLLDPKEISGARWRDTTLVKLPMGIWGITLGRFMPKKAVVEAEAEEEEEIVDDSESADEVLPAANVKKVAKKLVRSGEGLPRRRVKGRAVKKEQK